MKSLLSKIRAARDRLARPGLPVLMLRAHFQASPEMVEVIRARTDEALRTGKVCAFGKDIDVYQCVEGRWVPVWPARRPAEEEATARRRHLS